MSLISAELICVGILAVLVLAEWLLFDRLKSNPRLCAVSLFLLPVLLRLILLSRYPVPSPGVSDDFAQLLSADTLLHFRFANPTHPMHRFFETFFTLQEPTYSAMFPPGQGLLLALGKLTFGSYWAGPLLASGALAALSYWMLRAWTSPGWALVGGFLTAIEFGPLCEWTNIYWGGALAACAGCLIFGGLPRGRYSLVGLGLAIHAITRPFETLFLGAVMLIWVAYKKPRGLWQAAPALLIALLVTLLQNHAVTGKWTQLPYQLSVYEYAVPTTLTIQANPIPHRRLTREQRLAVDLQTQHHGTQETVQTYFARLGYRMRYARFFWLAPLFVAVPFFLPALRQLRFVWVAGTVALFVIGETFYPYFYPQYFAQITCLFTLIAVVGLSRMPTQPAAWLVRLAAAHFFFWYGLLLFGSPQAIEDAKPFATWHVINMGDPEGRIAIRKQLEETSGQHLVFVRYWRLHSFREWVHNAADIDSSRIVWARDLGEIENAKLRAYYPHRQSWLLQPDADPPRLDRQ